METKRFNCVLLAYQTCILSNVLLFVILVDRCRWLQEAIVDSRELHGNPNVLNWAQHLSERRNLIWLSNIFTIFHIFLLKVIFLDLNMITTIW